MSSNFGTLRALIREAILSETFAGYSPSKDDLTKMEVGKSVALAPDPSLPGTYPFVKKKDATTFKTESEVSVNDVLNYLSSAAKSKPQYSQEALSNLEGPLNVPISDIDPKYSKYTPTGMKLIGLGDGQFQDVTSMSIDQLIDVMKAYIADNPNFRFEIM